MVERTQFIEDCPVPKALSVTELRHFLAFYRGRRRSPLCPSNTGYQNWLRLCQRNRSDSALAIFAAMRRAIFQVDITDPSVRPLAPPTRVKSAGSTRACNG